MEGEEKRISDTEYGVYNSRFQWFCAQGIDGGDNSQYIAFHTEYKH